MADNATTAEDAIMNEHFKMAGIEDDTTTPAATVESTDAGTEGEDKKVEEQPKISEQAEGDKTQEPAKPDSTSSKPDSTKEQGKEKEGKSAPGPKDLKLEDGTVVKGGSERRWYEGMQTAKQEVTHVKAQLAAKEQEFVNLSAQVNAQTTALNALRASSPEVATSALRLYNDLTTNPLGTVTKLLAELKAQGHNVEGLGSAVDTAALQALSRRIDTAIPAADTPGKTEQQIQQEAYVEAGQFFARYPDAVTHEAVLADIVSKNPNVNLDDAYFQLKQAAIAQGYDWTQPLAPQVAAKKASGQQQQALVKQPAPLPNGRGSEFTFVDRDLSVTPAAGETTDDIIRAAMRENGYINSN